MNLFRVSIYAITLILFSYGVSSAQIPSCPCDTAELSNGLSGDEIIDIVCPGGTLGPDSDFFLDPVSVAVSLANPPNSDYVVIDELGVLACIINTDGEESVELQLTEVAYEFCRIRVIAGCSLVGPNPIPTLSEWGLIAMAGLLGLAGLFFVAWRKCLTLEA